jgi:hypothetical protein
VQHHAQITRSILSLAAILSFQSFAVSVDYWVAWVVSKKN